MKTFISILIRLFILNIVLGMGVVKAQNYIPVTTWEGPLDPAPQSLPAYMEEVVDSVFNTRFRRVTKDGDRGYYSLRPVFNRNSDKFLLNSGDIRNTEDGTLFGTLWQLAGNQSFRNPIWSKVDPDIIYGTMNLKFVSLNVVTKDIKLIRDLEAEDGFTSNDNGKLYMDNKQSVSGDDQYVVLSDVTRGGKRIAVIDIQTGERHAFMEDAYAHTDLFTVRQDDGDPNARMNVGISPNGDYIILGGEYHEHLFDDKLNYIRKLANHGHADFAIDTDSNEVYVSICPAKYEILSTGEIIDLLGPDSYACGHLNASANYKQPGWVYLSINDDPNDIGANGNAQGYEICAVKLDREGTNVRRVVHPHNTGQSNETSAYGVPNPEGTLLMFNSAWDNEDVVNAYIVKLTDPYKLTTTTLGKGNVLSSANGYYDEGTEVKITAVPDWQESFLRWEVDLSGTENPVTITIDSNMNIIAVFTGATGIIDENAGRNSLQIYPNPFTDITTIQYELDKSAEVKLSVINLAGQEVAVILSDTNKAAGKYATQWNGTGEKGGKLPSGTYVVKLEVNNMKIETKKMILNK